MPIDQIRELLDRRPVPSEEIGELLAAGSIAHAATDFQTVEYLTTLDDVFDQYVAHPAIAVLPAWGERGLELLLRMAVEGPHTWAAYNVLATTGLNRVCRRTDLHFLPSAWDTLPKYRLEGGVAESAIRRLRRLVLEQVVDLDGRQTFLFSLTHFSFAARAQQDDRQDLLLLMLVDSRMMLSHTLLASFEELLQRDSIVEEELHQFLAANPILLDPYASEIRSKHELGSDFITDFVVRRTNDEYILVEIEKSTDKLFHQDGSFSAALSKACAQVRDFQAWVNGNISYAQAKLPGLRRPEGLVVIGRRNELDKNMETRLSEENFSRRGHIKIVTFDDLLSQAKTVYRNMLEKPLVLRTRDQQTI